MPWEMTLPGSFGGGEASVALDSRGRIAVGVIYSDNTGQECCARAAIASWMLGSKPPTAQPLSPPQNAETGSLHHALQAPLLVIGRSAITALWTVGSEREREGKSGGEVQIYQAFGHFGGPLHVAKVFTAPDGVSLPHLGLEPDGDPVASWLDDTDKIRTVTGSQSGRRGRPAPAQRAPQFSEAVGFTNDDEGDTIFSYWSRLSEDTVELRYMTSTDGSRFTRPKEIGLTSSKEGGTIIGFATVLAGGHHTLVALWSCSGGGTPECAYYQGRIGSVSGSSWKAFGTRIFGKPPEGFVDSRGRVVIVYDALSEGLFAITANPGESPGPPRRFASPLRYYLPGTGADEEPPLPTSPNGHAILYFTNGENEQYLVRYTP